MMSSSRATRSPEIVDDAHQALPAEVVDDAQDPEAATVGFAT
jgi:hypothetical protein